jgi:hypothetical protein
LRRRSQAEPGGLSVGDDLTHEVRVQEISAARERLQWAESSPMSLTHSQSAWKRLEYIGPGGRAQMRVNRRSVVSIAGVREHAFSFALALSLGSHVLAARIAISFIRRFLP